MGATLGPAGLLESWSGCGGSGAPVRSTVTWGAVPSPGPTDSSHATNSGSSLTRMEAPVRRMRWKRAHNARGLAFTQALPHWQGCWQHSGWQV